MNRIPQVTLPTILPSPDAIRSGHQNIHDYESEFWEFQYESYRYLGDLDNETLIRRYKSILRNMRRLISSERSVIPIGSSLSSWYWLRKEHQTRLEFFIRELPLPEEPPAQLPENTKHGAPAWPHHPNACDVIFRFGKREYMQPLLKEGRIRVCPASRYLDGVAGDPRTDNELTKTAVLPKAYVRITTKTGQNIPLRSGVSRSVSSANYFVFCASCGYHPEMFSDFEADCCVVITDPRLFERRLEQAMASELPGWYFVALPVQYFDPHALAHRDYIDPVLSKDFAFAYQMEFRIAWVSLQGKAAQDCKNLRLGSLEDIAHAYYPDDAA